MCLAVPARIESIGEDNIAQCDIMGVKRDCSLDLTPQAQVGDYVLIHAGFAIEVVDEQAAQETLEIVRQLDPGAFEDAGIPEPLGTPDAAGTSSAPGIPGAAGVAQG